MISELLARINDRLATVPEPCSITMGSPIDIVEMGLIERVEFADGLATVTMCLTDPACVHFRSMQAYIADALSALPEVKRVEVVQAVDVRWTPDRAAADRQ